MGSEKELETKIISIISLVILGYVFFISVYNQIIVQGGGFFYVIIFGGILVLAFVMLSLVTKLIEISGEIKDNFMWSFVEVLLLCHLAFLFLVFRLSYTSTVPAEETVLYRAADLMRTGTLDTGGMDMFKSLIVHPSQYMYAIIVSIFLKISGGGPESIVTLNAAVLILVAFVMDRVVRKVAGRTCGIVAALCTLFVPSQSFAIYSYSSEFFFCLILILSLDLFLILNSIEEDNKLMPVYSALFGVCLGVLLFTEPLTVILVIIYMVWHGFTKSREGVNPAKGLAISAACMLLLFLVLIFAKSNALDSDMGEVLSGSFSRFRISREPETGGKYTFTEIFSEFHTNLDNQNTNVKDNYHFLINKDGEAYTQTHNAWFSLGTQMSYMFVIVMSIACAFYMFRNRYRDAIPCMLFLAGNFVILFFKSTDEPSTYFMFEVLIIIASCGLNHMYRNHHPEVDTIEQDTGMTEPADAGQTTDADDWKAISRARALIFTAEGDPLEEQNVQDSTQQFVQQSVPDSTPQFVQQSVQDITPQFVQQSVQQPEPVIEEQVNEIEQEVQIMNDPSQMNQTSTAEPAKSSPAPAPSAAFDDVYTTATISPEGYFSFFSSEPEPAPVSQPAVIPVPVSELEPDPVPEEYNEPMISEPVQHQTYTEPAAPRGSSSFFSSSEPSPSPASLSSSDGEYLGPFARRSAPAPVNTQPAPDLSGRAEAITEPVNEYEEAYPEEYTGEYLGAESSVSMSVDDYIEHISTEAESESSSVSDSFQAEEEYDKTEDMGVFNEGMPQDMFSFDEGTNVQDVPRAEAEPYVEPKPYAEPEPYFEPEPAAGSASFTEPEPYFDPESYAEPESAAAPAPASEPVAYAEPEPVAAPAAAAKPVRYIKSGINHEPAPAAAATPYAAPAPAPEPVAYTEPEPYFDPESYAEPESAAAPAPASEPVAYAEPEPYFEPEPYVEPEPYFEPEPVAAPSPAIGLDTPAPAPFNETFDAGIPDLPAASTAAGEGLAAPKIIQEAYDDSTMVDIKPSFVMEEADTEIYDDYEETPQPVTPQPVTPPRKRVEHGADAKASYNTAAMALGFDLSSFANAGDADGYTDEYSFGEGMPDINEFDTPKIKAAEDPQAVKKKKVIKKKIVKKVVKKPSSIIPGVPFDEIDLGEAFDTDHRLNGGSGSNGSRGQDGESFDYVIEI
ncbi:MAG: hypothetical protein K6F34_09835 [Lachnospiraceae bacterium]|nr:hypothetical protein [Lachnospiraceae bacterium]